APPPRSAEPASAEPHSPPAPPEPPRPPRARHTPPRAPRPPPTTPANPPPRPRHRGRGRGRSGRGRVRRGHPRRGGRRRPLPAGPGGLGGRVRCWLRRVVRSRAASGRRTGGPRVGLPWRGRGPLRCGRVRAALLSRAVPRCVLPGRGRGFVLG